MTGGTAGNRATSLGFILHPACRAHNVGNERQNPSLPFKCDCTELRQLHASGAGSTCVEAVRLAVLISRNAVETVAVKAALATSVFATPAWKDNMRMHSATAIAGTHCAGT